MIQIKGLGFGVRPKYSIINNNKAFNGCVV